MKHNRKNKTVVCSSKERFDNPQDARNRIRMQQKRQKRRSGAVQKLHAYKCLYCGGWHIGTPSHKK
jgi:hypothetical protein